MTTSIVDAQSLLAVDVGTATTRAVLFDVVAGRYRFQSAGTAPSTAGAPFHDVREGVRRAIDRLEEITERKLVGEDEQLILPSQQDGSGVDTFVATISAGPPVKVLILGLLEDVSVESAKELAGSTYTQVMDSISLNDRRNTAERIDTVMRLRPDLILATGGTEGGASQSLLNLLEAVGLACYLMPESQRPPLLFAGNSELHSHVRSQLEGLTAVSFAPNVRPDLENERLEPAQAALADAFTALRKHKLTGVKDLEAWARGAVMPTATAFGRLIRFLSLKYSSGKGVFGVDLGAGATTVAAGFSGDLSLGVYTDLGMGTGVQGVLEQASEDAISRWLPIEMPAGYVKEYIYNKTIHPATIPTTPEDLAVEGALAREALRAAVFRMRKKSPEKMHAGTDLLPPFEPIIAAGSVFSNIASSAHAMLMLLDGLQPVGITTLLVDQHHISSALGAASVINPMLAVQVLDTAFLYLGTVISPIGSAKPGTPVLRLKMVYENQHEAVMDVKQGTLEIIPLPPGQTATLHLRPLHRYDVGMKGPGRGGKLRVHGGALGVVIDARGRPLRLPNDDERRRESLKKWLWMLGG